MNRIKCTVAYDGGAFSGYQVQPDARTVQGEIETALTTMHQGRFIRIAASGRTDAGVHAKGQVFHFDSPLAIPERNWERALNTLTPPDIHLLKAEAQSSGFHSRFDATGKEYRYFIRNHSTFDLFSRHYCWQVTNSLDMKKMEEAAAHFVGTHDFTSFCTVNTAVEDKVRTVKELEITRDDDMVMVRVVGNGFLYNMVRIIVGTLVEIGLNKREPQDVKGLIEARNRRLVPDTAPPQGLFLWKVYYNAREPLDMG